MPAPEPTRISLHRPVVGQRERENLAAVLASGNLGGGGPWLERVEAQLEARLPGVHTLAVTSGTHALELAMMAHGIGRGDEVVVPAFTFPSTPNAALRQGADVVFADVRESDLNLDPAALEEVVTSRTRAVIVVHYGGVPCEMDSVEAIARARGILVIEDCAHALDASYRGRPCGTIGDSAALSFNSTKNVACGEGGAFITRRDALAERAARIREMGTDRRELRAGRVSRYTWHDVGSSFIPSELVMAVLSAQLERADRIVQRRRELATRYGTLLRPLEERGRLRVSTWPAHARVSGHIFFVLLPDERTRDACRDSLARRGIETASHFDCLTSTPFGRRLGRTPARPCAVAESTARRLLRLPLHETLSHAEQDRVVEALFRFPR